MVELKSLDITGYTYVPSLSYYYRGHWVESVGHEVSEVTIAATAAEGVSIAYAPQDADPNKNGHQLELWSGVPAPGSKVETTLAIVLRSSNGNFVRSYFVSVFREAPPSDDATLASLEVVGTTLSPAFDRSVTEYTTPVSSAETEATVWASTTHGDASISYSPVDADSGTDHHQVSLNEGDKALTITATAANGTTRTYTVTLIVQHWGARLPDRDMALEAGFWPSGVWGNGTKNGCTKFHVCPTITGTGLGAEPSTPKAVDCAVCHRAVRR